jgi:hypothetical protein
MGAPAAPIAGGGGAIPAGAASAAGPPGALGGAPAGVVGTASAAVPVPAATTVVAGARREPTESTALALAKAVVRKLRRDSDASHPLIEWAVGVFAPTDCVVASNAGFCFVPWGVYLPRTARLLAADKSLDRAFRERWFQHEDPARVLVEYAEVREARLVALAATKDSPELHKSSVESAVCGRERLKPGEAYTPAVLDEASMMHRLEAAHPDLYVRVRRLADPAAAAQELKNRLIVPMTDSIIDGLTTTTVGCPAELRRTWNTPDLNSIKPEAWDQYGGQAMLQSHLVDRLDVDADHGQRELRDAQWRAARAMEVVWGFAPADCRPSGQPFPDEAPPVADMLYAALAASDDDYVGMVEQVLRDLEAERRGS